MIDILSLINNCFSSASQWFLQIFTATSAIDVYLTIIFIILVMRFIVVPFMGASKGSDTARKKDSDNE